MPIAPDVKLGARVVIPHPDLINLYGCSVGDDSMIGAFVEVQRNAVIGARCKISSHAFVCEGVTIEEQQLRPTATVRGAVSAGDGEEGQGFREPSTTS